MYVICPCNCEIGIFALHLNKSWREILFLNSFDCQICKHIFFSIKRFSEQSSIAATAAMIQLQSDEGRKKKWNNHDISSRLFEISWKSIQFESHSLNEERRKIISWWYEFTSIFLVFLIEMSPRICVCVVSGICP
jgi:hypothetical protein